MIPWDALNSKAVIEVIKVFGTNKKEDGGKGFFSQFQASNPEKIQRAWS
jgi:hypothetical protein